MDTQVHRERWRLLHQMVRLLELPMTVLGLIWMVLLSVDIVRGLHGRLAIFSEAIWVLFGIDFGLELLIAPDKRQYLKRHWPVAVSLAVPALRIVRFARMAHLARTAGTIRFGHSLAILNRGLAALGATLRRRGFAGHARDIFYRSGRGSAGCRGRRRTVARCNQCAVGRA